MNRWKYAKLAVLKEAVTKLKKNRNELTHHKNDEV